MSAIQHPVGEVEMIFRIVATFILVALTVVVPSLVSAAGGIQSIGSCRTIDQPGSYVLANNITAKEKDLIPVFGSVVACIQIAADFVTLDLSGYTIFGPPRSAVVASIGIESDSRGVTVHGGAVTNFDVGIQLTGSGSVAEHNRAIANFQEGITAGPGVRVVGNAANNNGRVGITANCPSVVLQNVAFGNPIDINLVGVCTAADNSPLP